MRYNIWPITLILLPLSCTAPGTYTPVNQALSPKAPDCAMEIFMPGDPIAQSYRVLGMYRLEQAPFSTRCNWESAFKRFRTEACAVGADAVQFMDIEEPRVESTCYRMFGNFIHFQGQ